MGSSLTLQQQTSVTVDNYFRVSDEILSSTGIDGAVFVYKVSDDSFSHYATVTDLVNYPTSKSQAQSDGVKFYRQTTAVRDWASIDQAIEQKQMTRDRLALLLPAWDKYSAGFVTTVSVTISTL